MFIHRLKRVITPLLRNKTYGLLNIFGLAIGIACAGLIFLWVGNELSYDSGNVKKNRLYEVMVNTSWGGNEYTIGSSPRLLAASMKAEIPGIVAATRVSDESLRFLFTMGEKSLYAAGRYADPDLFSMFTIRFVQGDSKHPFPQLFSIVLTESAAVRFFGSDVNVIGRTVRMDNAQDYVVSGVVRDMPDNSTLQFEWLAPYESEMAREKARSGHSDLDWNSFGPFTYVELAPSADPAVIDRRLYSYIQQKGSGQKNDAFLFPMDHWHLYSEFAGGKETGGGRIRQVRTLSVIAWIVLLIACINFMNLATARSEKRAKEIGVRKVLGSGRRRLIRQFLGEAMVISFMATLLAVVLMTFILPLFNVLMGKHLDPGFGDPAHLAALLVIALICGLLAGSYPALYLSSFDPVAVLKGGKIRSGGATLIRKGLVVLQFSVSVVFIISTIIIYLQVQHVRTRNLGFDKDDLLQIDMQHSISQQFPAIKDDLLRTGVIEQVALADHATIYGGNSDDRFTWAGKRADQKPDISFRNVSPDFIATMGMHLAAGRDFPGTIADSGDVIVNQTLADLIDRNGVVGHIIQSPRDMPDGSFKNMRIVGVVDDYVFGNVYGSALPVIFFCKLTESGGGSLVYVRIRDQHNSQQTLAAIEAVIKKDNPSYPFQYRFVDDQFNGLFADEVQMSRISSTFAILSIFISCLGLFSLAAYTAERRIKEIGIRKVLGAPVAGLASLLSIDFLKLIGIACLLAFPVAGLIMHQWLQNYEYRITIHWWIFGLAALTALLLSVATVSIQAIRAAVANPVKVLRSE